MSGDELAQRLCLYLICGEGCATRELYEKTAEAIEGGVTAVQLRVKSWTGRETYDTAVKLRELCRSKEVLFIVNDRLDIALAAGADGVHLGQMDMPVSAARGVAGRSFIIGGTARRAEDAARAEREGADYIGCGAAFSTGTKSDAVVIGPDGIKHVLAAITIPSVAIGGINAANLMLLTGCGASGVSLSGAIMNACDQRSAARELRKAADLGFKD